MAASRLVLAAMLVAVLLVPHQATASLRSTMAVGGRPVPARGLLRSADVDSLLSTSDRSARRLQQASAGLNMIAFGDNQYGQADPPANIRTNAIGVAGGLYHTIARTGDETIKSWGDDSLGQVSGQPDDATIQAGGGVLDVAAGGSHSLVLLKNGTVLAWGDDSTGQSTVPDAAKEYVMGIAAGSTFSLAIVSPGRLLSWGTTADAQIPPAYAELTDIVAISARTQVSMALTSNGTILLWGSVVGAVDGLFVDFRAMMPAEAEPAFAIAAGSTHFMAINRDGRLFSWGVMAADDSLPPSDDVLYQGGRKATDIAAGYRHSLILMDDGNVIAFGDDQYGQLSVPAPAKIEGRATLVACGYRTSYVLGPYLTLPAILPPPPPDTTLLPGLDALGPGRDAVYWYNFPYTGNGDSPDLTFKNVVSIGGSAVSRVVYVDSTGAINLWYPDNVAVQGTNDLPAENVAHSVVTGETLTLMLQQNGTLRCYDTTLTAVVLPVDISENVVVGVAAGSSHGLALLQTGRVVAFGDGEDNKTVVPDEALDGVTAVAAGDTYSLAVRDGNVIFWGAQAVTTVPMPTTVTTGGNVKAIASGATHCLALMNDGSVVAWGSNSQGESSVPTAAKSGVTAIAAGNGFSVALLGNGQAVQWGWNASFITTMPSYVSSGVSAIAAGRDTAFALLGTTAVSASPPPATSPGPATTPSPSPDATPSPSPDATPSPSSDPTASPEPSSVSVAPPPGNVNVQLPGTDGTDAGSVSGSRSGGSSGPNKGAIAGGVVGGVVGAAIMAGLLVYFIKFRGKENFEPMLPNGAEPVPRR